MQIRTEEFKEVASTILFAADLDKNAANLELRAKGNALYVAVTNREYYVSVKFDLEEPEDFRAVVSAPLFLNLISGITAETFEMQVAGNSVAVKAGKSNYKLAMIYENDSLMELPVISINNPTVEMPISNDILKSIVNVNSKEISKVKNIDVSEIKRMYYIDETGCFTFTTGACLNSFVLEKPIKLLLNERIVKLFKLFKEDVYFTYGYDALENGTVQTKVTFETSNIYVAALITCDDTLLNRIAGPYMATKNFIRENYANKIVIEASALTSAINRLLSFTKNSDSNANMRVVSANVKVTNSELVITDMLGNNEVVDIANESIVDPGYTMLLNIVDLKLAVESYKNEHVTINCGNHQSVVVTCGAVSNLIPEVKQA